WDNKGLKVAPPSRLYEAVSTRVILGSSRIAKLKEKFIRLSVLAPNLIVVVLPAGELTPMLKLLGSASPGATFRAIPAVVKSAPPPLWVKFVSVEDWVPGG